MDAHGEKRPREDAVCLTCKKPGGPFPVLHPDCHHTYCTECVHRADAPWCQYCKTVWNHTLYAFNTPDGNVLIVRRIATGHLLNKKVFVHRHQNPSVSESTVRLMEREYPAFRAWLVANGMRTEKTAGQRMNKYMDLFGSNAISEAAGDDAWVVLGPVDESTGAQHAVYATDARTERVYITNDKIMPYQSESLSRRGLLAIIRAIQNQEEAQ